MKQKKLNRKLVLSKLTISNLSDHEMKDADGRGIPTFHVNCTTGCTDEICTVLTMCNFPPCKPPPADG